MKEKHGEVIHIIWEDWPSDTEYIKGHVTIEDASVAINEYLCGEHSRTNVAGIKHCWAKWVPAEKYSDFSMMFFPYDEKRRGAFAVTELTLSEAA